jgi:hypothetical protein
MSQSSDHLRELEARRALIRARSKQLFGGTYRAEIAQAIGQFGTRHWTVADLEGQLDEIPRSCVNKELSTFLACDLVIRHGRNHDGQYLHSTAQFPEYWAAARALTEHAGPKTSRAKVVPLRPRRRHEQGD